MKREKYKYSNNKILKVLISFGEYSLEYLRDIAKIKKEAKISFTQLNQRISGIERSEIRDKSLHYHKKRGKKRKSNK